MEAKDIPVYSIKIDDSDLSATGVNCVSIVKHPAIMSNFVALSAELPKDLTSEEILLVNKQRMSKVTLSDGKEMKGLLTGPLLIPDFQIFRMEDDGTPYFITFSAEVIEQIRDKFSKGGWHRNSDQEHYTPLGGNTIVELWIVENPERDKATALGLTVPKGTLMATMKVEDHEYFQREILSGNRKGFSIAGWFEYEGPIEKQAPAKEKQSLKPKLNMSTKPQKPKGKGIIAALAGLFFALKDEGAEQQATYTLEDSTGIIVVDETQQVFFLTEDSLLGDPLEDGEHLLSDGQTLVVVDGKMTELKPKEVDPEAEPAEASTDPAPVDATVAALAKASGVDGTKLAVALTAAKLALRDTTKPRSLAVKMKVADAEKTSILVTTEGKAIYVDGTSGYAWLIGDDLWMREPVPAGEHQLQDGTTLTVFDKIETYTDYDGAEVSITRSMVNFTASTVAVETLIPWLKETMSAITTATDKLTANAAEITRLKAENAKLKQQPAAPAAKVPATVEAKAVSTNPKVAMRDKRVAAALAQVENMQKLGA